MKRILLLVILLVTIIACKKTEDTRVVLNLKGEIPEKGEVSVKLYGYDKFLADHKATLLLIHREKVSDEIILEIPVDAANNIEPPVEGDREPGYYVNIVIIDSGNTYTQDYDKNPFIEVTQDSNIDVYMKKK